MSPLASALNPPGCDLRGRSIDTKHKLNTNIKNIREENFEENMRASTRGRNMKDKEQYGNRHINDSANS